MLRLLGLPLGPVDVDALVEEVRVVRVQLTFVVIVVIVVDLLLLLRLEGTVVGLVGKDLGVKNNVLALLVGVGSVGAHVRDLDVRVFVFPVSACAHLAFLDRFGLASNRVLDGGYATV
jgi:hypothetical protein